MDQEHFDLEECMKHADQELIHEKNCTMKELETMAEMANGIDL